jgi:hypothetical protein
MQGYSGQHGLESNNEKPGRLGEGYVVICNLRPSEFVYGTNNGNKRETEYIRCCGKD